MYKGRKAARVQRIQKVQRVQRERGTGPLAPWALKVLRFDSAYGAEGCGIAL